MSEVVIYEAEDRIAEEQLHGLSEEKLSYIRHIVSL